MQSHLVGLEDFWSLVFVDALQLSQQFFSHVGMISYLPGLDQY